VLLVQRLPVFYRQRDAKFFPGWTFAVSEFLLRLPWIFLDTWLWTVMLYFMVRAACIPAANISCC
jgi:hypothetical protein